MGLPPWFGDKAKRRKQNARSRAQERNVARASGGRAQAGSGSSWRAPGDVLDIDNLYECKYTDKSSFPLRIIDWEAIRAKAYKMGLEPVMIIDFTGGHKGLTRLMVIEVPREQTGNRTEAPPSNS